MAKTILIVDDNELLRATVGLLVAGRFEGVNFVESSNGEDAIEKARVTPPDLVILDVAMPGMNGLFVAPILKALAPKAPIILFTLYADEVHEPDRFGVDVVVPKAEGAETLLNAVRELLSQSTETPVQIPLPRKFGAAAS